MRIFELTAAEAKSLGEIKGSSLPKFDKKALAADYKLGPRDGAIKDAIWEISDEESQNDNAMLGLGQKHAAALADLFQRFPAKRNLFVYRGCDLGYHIGDARESVTYDRITSWSVEYGMARTFGEDLLMLEIKAGSNDGAYVAPYTQFPSEGEWICRPGLNLKLSGFYDLDTGLKSYPTKLWKVTKI